MGVKLKVNRPDLSKLKFPYLAKSGGNDTYIVLSPEKAFLLPMPGFPQGRLVSINMRLTPIEGTLEFNLE